MTENGCFNNNLVLVQVTGYIVAVVFGLCALIPTILHLVDFKGHCLLFTNGTWNAADGQFQAVWGSPFFCDYNVFWSFASVIVALMQLYYLWRNIRRNVNKEFLCVLLELLVCILVCCSALAGALITTLGYQRWCDAIMQRFEMCEDAASTTTDIDRKDRIDTAHFYIHYGIIQFGAWLCWACWVGLSLCSLLTCCSQHQDYVIRVSMARERARLVGDRRDIMT